MMKLILFVLSIVFIYPNENDSYTFKIKYTLDEIMNYRVESMTDFAFGSYQNQMNSDYKISEKYLGEKNGFIMLEKTFTDMISTSISLGEMSLNSEMNALVGIPYIVYIDSSGRVSDVETKYLQYEEKIRSMEMDMGAIHNYIYPFGDAGVDIKIGDSWNEEMDSIVFFPGDGEFENYMKISVTYTLDKVKQKGDANIAFIKAKFTISVDHMIWEQGSNLFEGDMAGSGKTKLRFDLDRGKRRWEKTDLSMKWNVTFDDKTLVETMNVTDKIKWIK